MFLQVGFGQEEFRTVVTLDHVLLLFRRQTHQVLVCAESFLFNLEFFLHGFNFFMFSTYPPLELPGLIVPLPSLHIEHLVNTLKIILCVQQVLDSELSDAEELHEVLVT